ncbi:tRNA1(Val) (adenine(37)-N6)-methyltransferase [Halocynthiibacter sp.]|uniref:tRNA1(Val) (adenine(37)-N6)-methyltransferase n=1 Tax=Halocynthiibacter sp. TaxID=1979210 RepID=UPI003C4375DA
MMSTLELQQHFPDGLTDDGFLSGRLQILQPRKGYRAGADPVLLAAACPAKPGDHILEAGCGAGVASLCLGYRVKNLTLTGVELQEKYARLAQENAGRNDLDLTIYNADISTIPAELKAKVFDQIIMNPPFFDRSRGSSAPDAGKDIALAGETPTETWIDLAARRLKPKGYLTLIQDIRRLPDVLAATLSRLGSVEVLPISARQGRKAHLFLMRARKEGRADFMLHSPLVTHLGDQHLQDAESYTDQIRSILRDGSMLKFP